jgi:uncharacterized protein
LIKPELILSEEIYSIFRFDPAFKIPVWPESCDFLSITKTEDEISIVLRQTDNVYPDDAVTSNNWRLFKLKGPLDLSLTGIIAGISEILAKNEIPVFIISTYNTDYFLIKGENLEKAILAFNKNNFNIESPPKSKK